MSAASSAPATPAAPLLTTPLNALHIELGARMVPFAGYSMPVQYPAGLMAEHVHTRTAAGRMTLFILMTVAQWEREAIGERTATAMQHKAASGEYTGGEPPFGYRVADDGVRLVRVEAEQAVLAIARELRSAGLSLRTVARELDARGIRSRVARPFSPAQIRRMVA